MVDRRRSRWIAFDASFYDDALGVMIRERFGPVGLVLFSAFLCACKRNVTQGQIVYGSEADALAQMGLPDLQLTNERGETYTLQTFFRALGHHKQTSIRRTGRLTYVTSTKWAKWQEAWGRQVEAEKKSRSRHTNTQDTTPTDPADTPPLPRQHTAERLPETDLDLDLDTDHDTDLDGDVGTTEEEEFDRRVSEAARLAAERRLAERKGEPVRVPDAWVKKTAFELLSDMRALARANPRADAQRLAVLASTGKSTQPTEPQPGYYRRFGS